MKTIKTYENFVNEEINLKKAAAGLALGAGLAFGSPVVGQTTNKPETTKSEDDEYEKLKAEVSFKPPLAEEGDTHIISGFRNYKLGDTKIYGDKVLSESISKMLKLKFNDYTPKKLPGKESNIIWFGKKESLFGKSINIYFGYVDNKLMCISIEWPESEINDDVLELLKSKFGEPWLQGYDNFMWKQSKLFGREDSTNSYEYYHKRNNNDVDRKFGGSYNLPISPSHKDDGEVFIEYNYGFKLDFKNKVIVRSDINIYNEELKNYISLKNKEWVDKEKAEKMKKINSETF